MWHFLRDLGTRRNEKYTLRFLDALDPLKKRLLAVEGFRKAHERYWEGLQGIAAAHEQERELLRELAGAYDRFREFNVSDLSKGAQEEWAALTKAYDADVEVVDQNLVTSLRAQLEGSRSTQQTFTLFGQYNRLFFRPCIQGRRLWAA